MIGQRYWSTGITVQVHDRCLWGASLEFLDDGFAQSCATQGRLETRYVHGDLARQLDLLIADAKRLGIEFREPALYWPGDGEDPMRPLPASALEVLKQQCQRLGWRSCY